jgi:hypothetical protein
MKKSAILIITVVLLQLFTSCNDYGSKFAGTWKNINNSKEIVTITISGKDFIVEFKGEKALASYNEAGDRLTADNDGTIYDLTINEQSKHLIFLNKEYEKE